MGLRPAHPAARSPRPALLAVGATAYLFDRSFSIYGGNIASTLAGEFSFSIALTFAVLFLGVLARGLETGSYRAWAAALLAATALCHIIPVFFAVAGAAVLLALQLDWSRVRWWVWLALVAGRSVRRWPRWPRRRRSLPSGEWPALARCYAAAAVVFFAVLVALRRPWCCS